MHFASPVGRAHVLSFLWTWRRRQRMGCPGLLALPQPARVLGRRRAGIAARVSSEPHSARAVAWTATT